MSAVELNEKFLVKIAGWEAVKQAQSARTRLKRVSTQKGSVLDIGNSLAFCVALAIKQVIHIAGCPHAQSLRYPLHGHGEVPV
jgi:hypothetical protein